MAYAGPEVNLCRYSLDSGDLGGLAVSDTWSAGATLAALYLASNPFEPDDDSDTALDTETTANDSSETPTQETSFNSRHAFDLCQQLDKTQWILNQHVQYKPMKTAMDKALDIARSSSDFSDGLFVTDSHRLAQQQRSFDDVDVEAYPYEGKIFTDIFFDLLQNMFQYNPHLRKSMTELLCKHPFFTSKPHETLGNNSTSNPAKRRRQN